MEKPSPSFSMMTSDLLSTCSGTKFAVSSILTNDMVKHAAWAAPEALDEAAAFAPSRCFGTPAFAHAPCSADRLL